MKSIIFIISILLLFSTNFAQNEASVEVEIISYEELLKLGLGDLAKIEVASFTNDNIFTTPSTISVIDNDMIKRYNIRTISEALDYISGFSVMRTYLKRNLPTSRGILQDHYANKVLIMINGIPSWNAVTGEGNIDRISINDVEKIEILKGPASVVYGTNAYSGAVNIVLKRSEINAIGLTTNYGNNQSFGASGNISIIDSPNEFSIFLSASSTKEDGNEVDFIDDKKVSGKIKEYIQSSNFTLNTTYKKHNLLFNAYSVDESYLGVSPRFASGTGKNHDILGALINYNFNPKLTDKLELKLNTFYDWNQRILSRSFDDNIRADISGYRFGGNLSLLYQVNNNFNIQLGTNYELKNSSKYSNINVQTGAVLEDNFMKDKNVYDYAIFSQLNYKISDFNFLLGARYNKNEFFGGNLSARGTLVYQINPTNSVKFVYGSSYRAPSLFELYFKTSTNTVLGEINLKPEKSNSFEIIYLTTFNKFFIQLLGYYSIYNNKIFRINKPVTLSDGTVLPNASIYTNGNDFSAKGVELELKYILKDNFNLFLNYSYTKGDKGDEVNNNGHYNFKYVSEHLVDLGINKQFGKLSMAAILSYQTEQGAPIAPISSQYFINANINYCHLIDHISVTHSLSVKNLLNKELKYPEYVGRTMNDIPAGLGRRIQYSMILAL